MIQGCEICFNYLFLETLKNTFIASAWSFFWLGEARFLQIVKLDLMGKATGKFSWPRNPPLSTWVFYSCIYDKNRFLCSALQMQCFGEIVCYPERDIRAPQYDLLSEFQSQKILYHGSMHCSEVVKDPL